MMKPEVANCGLALQHFLSLPETGELVSAGPQAGRILRPLCRILGVKPPPYLTLPRHPRLPRPPPEPASAEETPPAGTAADEPSLPPPGRPHSPHFRLGVAGEPERSKNRG
jgi:hypothetical protein